MRKDIDRDISLDWICGLLIIHMILGHISQWAKIEYVLDNVLFFFMPWFFFKAGMFHKIKDEKIIIKRSFHRLIIPFIIFSILGQLILSFQLIYIQDTDIKHYFSFLKYFVTEGSIPGNLALWFLGSLFICKIGFNWLCLHKVKVGLITFIFTLLSIILHYMKSYDICLPLYVANISYGMIFYCLGYSLKDVTVPTSVVVGIGLGILVCSYICHSTIDARTNTLLHGNYIIALIYELAAIIFINNIIKLIPYKLLKATKLEKVGRNSMSYYVSHWIIIIILNFICVQVLDITGGYHYWVILVIGNIIILPLITMILNRYFRRYIGY